MLASAIIANVRAIYGDLDAPYRVSDPAMLGYANQARRQIARVRPEEFRGHRSVQLVAGSVQQVPADCAFNFGPVRNMGADGATPGREIRPVSKEALEAFAPNWRSRAGAVVKEALIADPMAARYEVNPPLTAPTYAELAMAAFPSAMTAVTDDIGMSDRHEMAITYWMLHMIYSQETEEGSRAIADSYKARFMEEMA